MPESAFTRIERQANLLVVRVLHESLDEQNLSAVRADTSAAAAQSPQHTVVLDLAKVGFMPSLSLGGLVSLSREFKARGQHLVLTGLQPFVRQTMALTRLDRLFDIQDGVSGMTEPGRPAEDGR